MQEKLTTLTKEKLTFEKKLQHANTKLNQAQGELSEEKALRQGLELNQTTWQTKLKSLESELLENKTTKENEIKDLREQLRDLMFFLEAQNQIEKSVAKDDIVGGTIIVPEKPNTSEPSTRSRRHRRH